MEFGGLDCTGTESTLQECSVSSGFVRTWSKLFFSNQGDYSGVGCIPRSTGTPQISQSKKIFSACMGKIATLSPQLNFVHLVTKGYRVTQISNYYKYRIDYTKEWVMRLCNPRICG